MNGRALKEAGMQAALSASGDWSDYIIRKLRYFIRKRKAQGKPVFKIEELRAFAEMAGWEPPKSPNCWGTVPQNASKLGLIRWTGKYAPARSKRTHSHDVKTWRAL